MRRAGRVAAEVLKHVAGLIVPGRTKTRDLDIAARDAVSRLGAKPSFLGYRGYPAGICVSVNDEVVHGIPGSRVVQDGDIVSLDFGAYCEGFHGDKAVTVAVGKVSKEARRLTGLAEQALAAGVAQARAGNHLSDVSHAIQECTERAGFSVVRDLCGHGVGTDLHEEPQIMNYGPPGEGIVLEPGMALAIEPMICAGSWQVATREDGWTVVTRDGSLSAHFEHTVLVTEAEPEILTALEPCPGDTA
jgi:methionyl aminopeptidase